MPRALYGGLRRSKRGRVHCSCFDLSKGQLIGDMETSYSLSLASGCSLVYRVSFL